MKYMNHVGFVLFKSHSLSRFFSKFQEQFQRNWLNDTWEVSWENEILDIVGKQGKICSLCDNFCFCF